MSFGWLWKYFVWGKITGNKARELNISFTSEAIIGGIAEENEDKSLMISI